jgi:hypothetical protein
MSVTFGRHFQAYSKNQNPGVKTFGLASEAALHKKTACSRSFGEQAGKVNDTV